MKSKSTYNRIIFDVTPEQYAFIKRIADALDQSVAKTMQGIAQPLFQQTDFLDEQLVEVLKTKKTIKQLEQKLAQAKVNVNHRAKQQFEQTSMHL